MKYLMFNLSGPLQAWGSPLPGNLRPTEDHPTKSGIVGLLGACLGIAKKDSESLKELGNKVSVAFRVDAPGYKMSDFHIIKNPYFRYQTTPPKGKPVQTTLTLRDYLCNAVFTVCIQGEDIDTWYQAMRQPVHVPVMGRKSCLPNALLSRIIDAENILEAFKRVKIYWEGTDTSITPVKEKWKYDQPRGYQKFAQRLEYMGYIERSV